MDEHLLMSTKISLYFMLFKKVLVFIYLVEVMQP